MPVMIKFRGWKTRKQTLHEVLDALQRMERSLAEIRREGVRGHVDITVENLKVDQANLERLVFHLDSLDIQDLSGALNLGNNFGVKVAKGDPATNGSSDSRSQGSQAAHPQASGTSFGSPLMRSELLSETPITTRWKSEMTGGPTAAYREALTETKNGYKIALNADKST